MNNNLNKLSIAAHNEIANLNDDVQYSSAVEFFQSFTEEWAEEMADALEKAGYVVNME